MCVDGCQRGHGSGSESASKFPLAPRSSVLQSQQQQLSRDYNTTQARSEEGKQSLANNRDVVIL